MAAKKTADSTQKEKPVKQKVPAVTAKIHTMCQGNSSTKAYASVCLLGRFVIKDIAVMEGKNGLFARMPHRKYTDAEGIAQYSDTFFCLDAEDRTAINHAVLDAYEQELEQTEALEEELEESEGMAPQM